MTDDLAQSFRQADANAYEQFRPHYSLKAIGKIFSRFGIKPGSTFADFGAGTGFLSVPLAGTNLVYHVDASKAMNAVARAKYERMQGDAYRGRLRILESDAASADIPPKSVDVVLMGNSAHWFLGESAAAVQEKLEQICKPDAKVVVAYIDYSRDHGKAAGLFAEVEQLFPSTWVDNGMIGLRSGRAAQLKSKSINGFIAPQNRREYREEQDVALTKEQFIGFVSTVSYAIKDGMTDERRAALADIFDAYAQDAPEGKRLPMKLNTLLVCGDRAPYRKEAAVML